MADRAQVIQQAAEGLRKFSRRIGHTPAMVGFDGFVDSIIAVVDQRHSADDFDAVRTIDQFGKKIAAAAGKSSNYEFVVTLQKLGGNGPIMANALASMGLPVTYIGCVGLPEVHPVFMELVEAAEEVVSISEPGMTDAVEFDDGKLLLGKYTVLNEVNWTNILDRVGRDKFIHIAARSRLLGMVNWTMLNGMGGIWQGMIDDILPHVPAYTDGRRMVFIDLADPEKRTRENLLDALHLTAKFEQHVDTVLGFNLKEAVQVAEVLDVPVGDDPESEIEAMALAIREKLDVQCVVVHPRKTAAAAIKRDGKVTSAMMVGTFTNSPKLSTGAGDNFNAGFCLGLLADRPIDQALCAGNASSGFYVRNARSATLAELADFCGIMPEAE